MIHIQIKFIHEHMGIIPLCINIYKLNYTYTESETLTYTHIQLHHIYKNMYCININIYFTYTLY